ncbi:MAG: hypothetical protein KME31_03310 [Tolypothrix carrinoi HA7290-LM1]|nr:hypothetical protein [Tolypothrix carrinoi HA7290-LM1]
MGCTKHESFPHTPHPTPHTQERSDDKNIATVVETFGPERLYNICDLSDMISFHQRQYIVSEKIKRSPLQHVCAIAYYK